MHADDRMPLAVKMIEALLPSTYSAEPIRAVVVDDETGFPLEGVHVVARWEIGHIVGGNMPSLAVQEATTDRQGEFVIPGFPPRPRPSGGGMQANAPQLLLFKSGFAVLRLRSEPKETFVKHYPNYKSLSAKDISSLMSVDDDAAVRPVQRCFWNNMTIGLTTFSGSDREWLLELSHIAGAIRDDEAPFARGMLAALKAEQGRFSGRKFYGQDRMRLGVLFYRLDRLLGQEPPR